MYVKLDLFIFVLQFSSCSDSVISSDAQSSGSSTGNADTFAQSTNVSVPNDSNSHLFLQVNGSGDPPRGGIQSNVNVQRYGPIDPRRHGNIYSAATFDRNGNDILDNDMLIRSAAYQVQQASFLQLHAVHPFVPFEALKVLLEFSQIYNILYAGKYVLMLGLHDDS